MVIDDELGPEARKGLNKHVDASISLDERAILHGVAASLSKEALEEFKEYLQTKYPELKDKRNDPYFAYRFTYYIPLAGFEQSRNYLAQQNPEVYKVLCEIRINHTPQEIPLTKQEIIERLLC